MTGQESSEQPAQEQRWARAAGGPTTRTAGRARPTSSTREHHRARASRGRRVQDHERADAATLEPAAPTPVRDGRRRAARVRGVAVARLGRALLRAAGGVTLALGHDRSSWVGDDWRPSSHLPARRAGGLRWARARRDPPPPPAARVRRAPRAALDAARELLAVLAERPGYVRGWLTRAVDDPDLLVLAHEWEDVGSYRRALSAYEVKLRWPVLATAADEATAFEVLVSRTPDSVVESASDPRRGRRRRSGSATPPHRTCPAATSAEVRRPRRRRAPARRAPARAPIPALALRHVRVA